MKWRRLTWLGMLGAALLAATPALGRAGQINIASLQYLHETLRHPGESAAYQLAASHPRAATWNGLAALQAGEAQTALNSAGAPAAAGDQLAIQLSAEAYEMQGDYRAALPAWEAIRNFKGLLRIAAAAEAGGDLETASAAYTAAWRVDMRNGASPLVAFLLAKQNDPAAAEAVLRQALPLFRHDRIHTYWLLDLAALLESQERWADAALVHEQAIAEIDRMYPGAAHTARRYADLARAHLLSGQNAEAIVAIEQAITELDEYPGDAVAVWLTAGQIYEAAGDKESARRSYNQLLAIDGNNAAALTAIQRLAISP